MKDANGELTDLPNISAALEEGPRGLISWHSLSSQAVDFNGPRTANATSYLQGTFFEQCNPTGQIVVLERFLTLSDYTQMSSRHITAP